MPEAGCSLIHPGALPPPPTQPTPSPLFTPASFRLPCTSSTNSSHAFAFKRHFPFLLPPLLVLSPLQHRLSLRYPARPCFAAPASSPLFPHCLEQYALFRAPETLPLTTTFPSPSLGHHQFPASPFPFHIHLRTFWRHNIKNTTVIALVGGGLSVLLAAPGGVRGQKDEDLARAGRRSALGGRLRPPPSPRTQRLSLPRDSPPSPFIPRALPLEPFLSRPPAAEEASRGFRTHSPTSTSFALLSRRSPDPAESAGATPVGPVEGWWARGGWARRGGGNDMFSYCTSGGGEEGVDAMGGGVIYRGREAAAGG